MQPLQEADKINVVRAPTLSTLAHMTTDSYFAIVRAMRAMFASHGDMTTTTILTAHWVT